MKLFLISLIVCLVIEIKAECTVCQYGKDVDLEIAGCSDLADKAASASADICDGIHLEGFQLGCCENAPEGVCSLCPDGSTDFNLDKKVPNIVPGLPEISCLDVNGESDFLDDIFEKGTCDDTLLRRSAAWCGCPDVLTECNLCAGNAEMGMSDQEVEKVFYGFNCAFFNFAATMFTADECSDLGTGEGYFKIDPAAFCGCPGTSASNSCSLCKSGEVLNSNKELSRGYTCGELANSFSYIVDQEFCIKQKTEIRLLGYEDECCIDLTDSSDDDSATESSMNGLLLSAMILSFFVL